MDDFVDKLRRELKRAKIVKVGPDEFPLEKDDAFVAEHTVISEFLEEAVSAPPYQDLNVRATRAGKKLLATRDAERVRVAIALTRRLLHLESAMLADADEGSSIQTAAYEFSDWRLITAVEAAFREVMRRTLEVTAKDLEALLRWQSDSEYCLLGTPPSSIVKLCEKYAKDSELTPKHRRLLDRHLKRLRRLEPRAEVRKLCKRIDTLLGHGVRLPLVAGDPWADAALELVAGLSDSERANWSALLVHAGAAAGGKPTKKWRETAIKAVVAVGIEHFSTQVGQWLTQIDAKRGAAPTTAAEFMLSPNVDVLKGLVWCAGVAPETRVEVVRGISDAAISAYKKIPGIGPRCVKLGNACVYALGQINSMDAVAQLARLRVKVKFGTAQKGISKSLDAAAERTGIPPDEIEEIAVPTYGLQQVGRLTQVLGAFTAELAVTGSSTTQLTWLTESKDGEPKRQKSVPKRVREEFADELKELRATTKDLRSMLSAQQGRMEQLFLDERRWPLAAWRERYLDHPVVGTLARRLIWRFWRDERPVVGAFLNGCFVDAADHELVGIDSGTRVVDSADREIDGIDVSESAVQKDHDNRVEVELWHPITAGVEDVIAWRDWLERHQITQPFKQAHREIYVLTDAERATAIYSNRFAAHVIKQYQFHSLCAARGWRDSLRLMVDAEFPPTRRTLEKWGLRAEFWTEVIGENYGEDTSESGAYLFLTTDQVRFYAASAEQRSIHGFGGGYTPASEEDDEEPLRLEDVPALVFSEIMRDVDLFVGVASVGNDPNWYDGGTEGRYQEYWMSYSFGDLSASAKTRREVLEKLLPRLKIADRASLAEKFLVIKGDVRTYKIHLGSGNILMEPNDQYLCIIPKMSAPKSGTSTGEIFLPFEGDRKLAEILSKALLLAGDARIKDPTILSQLRME